ncbi:MAG: terpene cyclase/mutase family protein [Phycisphaerae bacterium]|nr:terpene cyclase/mutase family protein [Phycisphaerae bacterium]
MNELNLLTVNIKNYITGLEDASSCYEKLSSALNKKNYKSKLDFGMEHGCQELFSTLYSFETLTNNLLFLADVSDLYLIGLTSEKLQSEISVMVSKEISTLVHGLIWWGMGRENDFETIRSWFDVLNEISELPNSAPCNLGRVKNLRLTTKKETELIRLWKIIFKSRSLDSIPGGIIYKQKALDIFRDFATDYPEITNVYGFDKLLKIIESSPRYSKKTQKNDPIRKCISIAAKIVAGRAKTVICRTILDNRKKAEAWLTATHENSKKFQKFRSFTKAEVLQKNLKEWYENEEDCASILQILYKNLFYEPESISNKQELISAIKKIYQSQNNTNGEPPWYPDFRENDYYPNPDIEKCSHFLLVLGGLEQGNLGGRWEEESLQYLLKNQAQEGYWSSSTFRFRPNNYTTVIAMHALGMWKPTGWEKAVKKAADWLWKQQQLDGSWKFYGGVVPNKILLDAINLAEGKFEHSLKLSKNPIEFVDIEKSCAPENPSHIMDNMVTNNISKYPSNLDESSIKESFTFRLGQVLFAGKDLNIKTGMAQDILKILVENFGFVIPFKKLVVQSTDFEADVALRGVISYLRTKLKRLPIKIENRKQSGYIMQLPNGSAENS